MKIHDLHGARRAWWAGLGATGVTLTRLWTAGALGLFLMQNAEVTYFIAQNADSRAVIRAFDDDAGNAIDVVGRSTWVTDNGFASYGPVYFRLASTLGAWLAPLSDPGALPPADAVTRADHFVLMLTSLVAVALFALFLASFLGDELWFTLILATLLEWTLLKSSTWQYLILKAHPDQTLGLIVALATSFTWRTWRDPEDLNLRRVSAWAWGVALSTKASIIFFTPFVGLAFLWTQTRERVPRALRYVGHVALAYFVIGFPQNFNLPRLYRFLKYQSGYSKPATVESVTEWFTLWTDQLIYPLAALLILLALKRGWRRPARKETICALVLAFAPFVLLLPQKILPPHAHYPIPIIAAQLTLLLALFTGDRPWSPRGRAAVAAGILVLLYVVRLVPPGFGALLTKELESRPEARAVFQKIVEQTERGLKVYIDPYVPSSRKMNNVTVNWRTTKEIIAEGRFDRMVLNRPYFSRYFAADKQDYVEVYNADVTNTRAFYALFKDQPTRVKDPVIGTWHREAQNGQWEIWTHDREDHP